MNETERIERILRETKGSNNYSELSRDMIVSIVFEFDIYEEIKKALQHKPSLFTQEVDKAMEFTRPDGGSIFDCDHEAV